MTTLSERTEKFVEASDAFIVIEGQPTDSDVNQIFEALSRILYPVEYDEADEVHNLIGIIQDDKPYKTKHGSSFPLPKRPKIFDKTIHGLLPVTIATRKKEAAHASLRTDWAVYNTAEHESGCFILKVVDHVWLSELLKGLQTYFSDVIAKTMLYKLQEIYLGNHEIDILVFQDKMCKMHNEWETIPQYTKALKDAQQQAKHAKIPIGDANLVMYTKRAMLSTERYLKANDLWEDLNRVDRTWKEWKVTYTNANRKAIVKRMAEDNLEQFGGAATGGTRGTGGGSGGGAKPSAGLLSPAKINKVEGCFDSLAGAEVTSKDTLDELVKSNATLAKVIAALTETNSCLAKKVEHQAAELKNREGGGVEESSGIETRGGNEGSYCPNCKRTTWHTPDNCFELNKNRSKRPSYWKSVL